MLNKALAILLAIAAGACVVLGFRSKMLEAQRDKAREKAEAAKAGNKTHRRIDKNLADVRKQHRQEDEADQKDDTRDDFGGDW